MDLFRPPFDDPDVLPLVYDREQERVRLVRLSEADYQAASFLDERLLLEAIPRIWAPWAEFSVYPRPPTKPCDFIFHIGHVGSTLVSRVLGESAAILALREPAVLRSLATLDRGAEQRERCAIFLDYLSRAFRPEQRALIKATSFVGEIGPELMTLRPTANAILMFVSPQSFLAGIFAGDNSRREAKTNAPSRRARLGRRLKTVPAPLADMSEGEVIAMGWLVEVMALAEMGRRCADRVLWLDFDYLLQRPVYWLGACLVRLGGKPDEEEAARLARSPAFQRYSKGQEHAYDASLRERLLGQAARDHAPEIERGLQWLNAVAAQHPSVAEDLKLIASVRRR